MQFVSGDFIRVAFIQIKDEKSWLVDEMEQLVYSFWMKHTANIFL